MMTKNESQLMQYDTHWTDLYGDIRIWSSASFYEVAIEGLAKKVYKHFPEKTVNGGISEEDMQLLFTRIVCEYKKSRRTMRDDRLKAVTQQLRQALEQTMPAQCHAFVDYKSWRKQGYHQLLQEGSSLENYSLEDQISHLEKLSVVWDIPGQSRNIGEIRQVMHKIEYIRKSDPFSLPCLLLKQDTKRSSPYQRAMNAAFEIHRHLSFYLKSQDHNADNNSQPANRY